MACGGLWASCLPPGCPAGGISLGASCQSGMGSSPPRKHGAGCALVPRAYLHPCTQPRRGRVTRLRLCPAQLSTFPVFLQKGGVCVCVCGPEAEARVPDTEPLSSALPRAQHSVWSIRLAWRSWTQGKCADRPPRPQRRPPAPHCPPPHGHESWEAPARGTDEWGARASPVQGSPCGDGSAPLQGITKVTWSDSAGCGGLGGLLLPTWAVGKSCHPNGPEAWPAGC